MKQSHDAGAAYHPDDLEFWTRGLWSRSGEERWHYYLGPPAGTLDTFSTSEGLLKPLLHVEMKHAARRGCLPKLREGEQVTLVILVGDRFEPLLQAIWAYCPDRILPVLNTYYRARYGADHRKHDVQWRELWSLIQRLPLDLASGKDPTLQIGFRPVQDSPTDVFNFLHDQLRGDLNDPRRRVVIDITGAKKTMVAGAFLFAAYTNAEISYVDFDRYDPQYGPYGYTCRIGSIANPFQDWALRSWERAAELYKQHDFVGALAALPDSLSVGSPDWNARLSQLRTFVALCDKWDNGQLKAAFQDWDKLPADLQRLAPTTVSELHDCWADEAIPYQDLISKDFLNSPRKLVIYGLDELARAKRLLGEDGNSASRRDYRSAFARAYALHETLLKARTVTLFVEGGITVQFDKKSVEGIRSTDLTPEWCAAGLHWVLNWMESELARDLLLSSNQEEAITAKYWEVGGERRHPLLWRNSASPPYRPDSILNMDAEVFTEYANDLRLKRNVITHTYVPVLQEDAKQVIQLAEANLEDYRQVWVKQIDRPDLGQALASARFDVPSWEDLLTACELTFIPRPRSTNKEGT